MTLEFHYRLARRAAGWRPGSHPGSSLGMGLEFVTHASLLDRPDPRRIDLRASLRDPHGDWRVRVQRQRVGIAVQVLVDVSASMRFGVPRSKLERATDFVQSLAVSAWRVGDALGLLAFDTRVHDTLHLPPRHGRGLGGAMAARLLQSRGGAGGVSGLADAAVRLGSRPALVFVLSDFHWELEHLGAALDMLAPAQVVPIVVWDAAELEPPARDAIVRLEDLESGRRRTLWLRPSLRRAWRQAVHERQAALAGVFASRALRPFFMPGPFDADAMSRYFLEGPA
jgi:hypothetical protein